MLVFLLTRPILFCADPAICEFTGKRVLNDHSKTGIMKVYLIAGQKYCRMLQYF